jgi:hypothetical protein
LAENPIKYLKISLDQCKGGKKAGCSTDRKKIRNFIKEAKINVIYTNTLINSEIKHFNDKSPNFNRGKKKGVIHYIEGHFFK